MSQKSDLWNKCRLLFCVGMWSVFIVGAAAWLTAYFVGTLRDPFAKTMARSLSSDVFKNVVSLTDKKVVRYLGEWEFLEPKIPGHFHHIGRWYQSDKQSFCIDCHGPSPHSRTPKIRAFLNMHNLFTSCQVCHVREQEGFAPTRFGWIDIADGKLCPNPDMTKGAWGEYGAKIVPLTGPVAGPQPQTLEEEEAFAAEFHKSMDKLSDRQKAIGNKFIHRRCVDTPVSCSNCHNSQRAFLPYTDLGYSSDRASFLVSVEVVDLVAHYETFYMPNLLKTDKQTPEPAGENNK